MATTISEVDARAKYPAKTARWVDYKGEPLGELRSPDNSRWLDLCFWDGQRGVWRYVTTIYAVP